MVQTTLVTSLQNRSRIDSADLPEIEIVARISLSPLTPYAERSAAKVVFRWPAMKPYRRMNAPNPCIRQGVGVFMDRLTLR